MAAKENLDIDEKKSAPKGDFFEVHKKLFVGILVFFCPVYICHHFSHLKSFTHS
jgi:hypothetical protein